MALRSSELIAFSKRFDRAYEAQAMAARGQFLRAFPLSSLKGLTLDQYVIGKGTPSFCSLAEVKTKSWANMQGATARKFGIYFGRTKSDSHKEYRFTHRFGESAPAAFRSVKAALLRLVLSGQALDFAAIDSNPLSQMFKAKVLSLYFPDHYINICSAEHLAAFVSQLAISAGMSASSNQHALLVEKTKNPTTRGWSNPKFMSFLYEAYLPKAGPTAPGRIAPPPKSKPKEVDFEALQAAWGAIGRASEEFALQWERDRLLALGDGRLAGRIEDRRKFPAYGYDFLSYTSEREERYIEVKSLGSDQAPGAYRFFLSENERAVSMSAHHSQSYYFYLVLFGGDGKPRDLLVVPAASLYPSVKLEPYVHVVRLAVQQDG